MADVSLDMSSVARAFSPFSKQTRAFWGLDVSLDLPTEQGWLQM
jgi:hypothetical protein